MEVTRNDIWFAKLGIQNGSIQGGTRPVYVIQNNMGNKFSPTTIVAPITSKMSKNKLPTHILINSDESGLEEKSLILCEQIQTVNKNTLIRKVCHVDKPSLILDINSAIKTSLNL